MPSQKNIQQVKKLKEKLEKAKSVILADYRGLKVEQINELRQKIKEAGGELRVSKNTLLGLALKNTQCCLKSQRPVLTEKLKGPTAVLFSYEDEIAPLKALYQFFQEHNLPKIKVGFFEDKLLEENRVIELAKLPSKEALQLKLIAALSSPISGLVYVLKGNLQKLVGLLRAIEKSKK